MPCSVTTSSFNEAGASRASAFAILSVKLSLRMLPTITTMLKRGSHGMSLSGGAQKDDFEPYSELCKRCKCMNCKASRQVNREAVPR
jgi:hypothetical protein